MDIDAIQMIVDQTLDWMALHPFAVSVIACVTGGLGGRFWPCETNRQYEKFKERALDAEYRRVCCDPAWIAYYKSFERRGRAIPEGEPK